MQRLQGLMFKTHWAADQGLLFRHCNSVHTCFMRFDIDLVYLDAQWRITHIVPHLRPWRMSVGARGSVHVLELAAGSVQRLGWRLGDALPAALPQGA